MRQEVTFRLQNPFPELESICYEFNKMILSGMGNHAQLELNESGNNEYITIKMFRKRNYPSIVVNRDIIPADFETSKMKSCFSKLIQMEHLLLYTSAIATMKFQITLAVSKSFQLLNSTKQNLF